MTVETLVSYGVHGLLIAVCYYLARRQNALEKMLLKCLGGDKLTDEDLQALDKSL